MPITKVSLKNWDQYASRIAYPANPRDLVSASVDRLMEDLGSYVVVAKNVRPQFPARNHVQLIKFATKEDAETYNEAWEEFKEKERKLKGREHGNREILLAMLIFKMKAELLKARPLARAMYETRARGFAPIMAANYKATIAKTLQILIEDCGVPRSKISLIWGGDKRFDIADSERLTSKEITAYLMAMSMNIDAYDKKMHKRIQMQMEAELAGLSHLPKEWKLGAQSKTQRQEEIDRFQRQDSDYCMFTYKSGGIGLSLHHSDKLTKQKVRRKPSGFAIEEDIPRIPTLPRKVFLTPTWSAMELVQGLGRGARITSLSETEQIICFFEGTIEEAVAVRVSKKLKCLRSAIRQKETWELDDAMWDGDKSNIQEHIIDYKRELDTDNQEASAALSDEDDVIYGDADLGDDENND